MHRLKLILPFLAIALIVLSPAAFAAKFLKVSVGVTDGNVRVIAPGSETFHGGLLVEFREVGVPGNQSTTYVVTADATATYACINNGDNHPQAANKEGVAGPVSATATFTSGTNGQVFGAIPVPPLGPGAFLCPPGQSVVLADVSYTNVVISDITNGASSAIPGTFTLTLVPLQ